MLEIGGAVMTVVVTRHTLLGMEANQVCHEAVLG